MANIFEFDGYRPVISETSFIHPNASVIGNVIIGGNVYVGPGASIRGDFGAIIIENGCNIQDNCTVHMFPGVTVLLKENAHIGHGAVIHGAEIGRNVLVGMGAIVMDNVIVGDNSIIGALSFVKDGMIIPDGKIVIGNPAKIVKDMTDERISWKTEGTKLYQELSDRCLENFKPCEPLREPEPGRKVQHGAYKTFKSGK